MRLIKLKKSGLLFCLYLFSASYTSVQGVSAASDSGESQLYFDPDGQFVRATGQVELHSYALEDINVGFDDVLKLNATSLFEKEADLSGGIKGTVESGGFIEAKLYAYDEAESKSLIYHILLTESSPSDYSEGDPLFEDSSTSTGWSLHRVKSTAIKELMQSVGYPYKTTKKDLDRSARTQYAMQQQAQEDRVARNLYGGLLGMLSGFAIGLGIVLALPSGGTSLLFSAPGLAIVAGLGGAGGIVGYQIDIDPVPVVVPVEGSTMKQNYTDLTEDRELYPMGTYPVQLRVTLKDATMIGIKIPGVGEVSPNTFYVWNTYSAVQLNQELANNYFWQDTTGLRAENPETPEGSDLRTISRLSSTDYDASIAHIKLTVNPGTPNVSPFFSHPATRRWASANRSGMGGSFGLGARHQS